MLPVIYKIDRIHGRLNAWIHRHKHSLETDGGPSNSMEGIEMMGGGSLINLLLTF